jgi:NAD(P)H dehydrogenase (quinone)
VNPRVPETLSPEILAKMYAPAKPDYPILTLDKFAEYDGWLFGIPTRYGSMPAQWKVRFYYNSLVHQHQYRYIVKTFWDSTGGLWQSGKLFGKYAGTFVSTAGPGGGQETTAYTSITTFTHHGINYVPLGYGYKNAAGEACFEKLSSVEEVHGGMFKSHPLGTVCLVTLISSRFALGCWNLRQPYRYPHAHSF